MEIVYAYGVIVFEATDTESSSISLWIGTSSRFAVGNVEDD